MAEPRSKSKGVEAGGRGGLKLVAMVQKLVGVAQWLARENQKMVAGGLVQWCGDGLKVERVTV